MATLDKYVKHRNLSKIECALFFFMKDIQNADINDLSS